MDHKEHTKRARTIFVLGPIIAIKAHSEHCAKLLSPHSWISRSRRYYYFVCRYLYSKHRPHREPPEYTIPIACIIKRAKIARVLTLYFKVYVKTKVWCTVRAITRSAAKTTKNVLIFRDQSVHVPCICTVSSTSMRRVPSAFSTNTLSLAYNEYTIASVGIDLKSI